MGHRSLKPSRVHQIATQLLETHTRQLPIPPWLDTIGSIPPGEILTRSQPPQVRHKPLHLKSKVKKPSKLFRPQPITYEEDELRQNFFADHPWELARPRVILEQDGKDGQRVDWSRLQQPGRQLNGESVIQRQLWLLKNESVRNPKTGRHELMTSQQAYDKARQEFYTIRHEQEVERRVAKEEALSTGAYFGKTRIEIGMGVEDAAYESWKKWAVQEISVIEQQKQTAYTGSEIDEAVAELPSVEPVGEEQEVLAE